MKSVILILTLSMIFVLSGCGGDDAPTAPAGTNLKGTVTLKAGGAPVSGAKISLGEQETTSDASGNYTIANVPTVKQALWVEKANYAVFIEDVSPVKGENIFDVELETHAAYCQRVTSVVYRGTTYNTVLVGNQCWFKENLNAGTRIDWEGNWEDEEQQPNNTVLEKYCLNNREANCDKWGGLYTWNEAMNHVPTFSNQGICPDGWHVPTIDEYHVLGAYVEENSNALKVEGFGDPVNYPQGVGTNESGWSGLMAGTLFMENAGAGPVLWADGAFPRWWSSTVLDDDLSHNFGVFEWNENTFYEESLKYIAYSIRCLKD
jgi:uncharacterized protein (TIGR02145 family)